MRPPRCHHRGISAFIGSGSSLACRLPRQRVRYGSPDGLPSANCVGAVDPSSSPCPELVDVCFRSPDLVRRGRTPCVLSRAPFLPRSMTASSVVRRPAQRAGRSASFRVRTSPSSTTVSARGGLFRRRIVSHVFLRPSPGVASYLIPLTGIGPFGLSLVGDLVRRASALVGCAPVCRVLVSIGAFRLPGRPSLSGFRYSRGVSCRSTFREPSRFSFQ